MSKLMRANLIRLFHNKTYLFCLIGMPLFGVFITANQYFQALHYNRTDTSISPIFFSIFAFICIIFSAFNSLFLGTEFSEGTIRNKLIVGHTRNEIYLSNYLTCLAADLSMVVLYAAAACAVGIPLLGNFKQPWTALLLIFLNAIFLIAAQTALFVLLAMLNQNKAAVCVISLLLTFILLLFSIAIINRLMSPEVYEFYELAVDGTPVLSQTPNPGYIRSIQREIYQFIVDFLPTGQGIQFANGGMSNPLIATLYCGIILFASTVSGLFFFRRKDLK